MAHPDPIAHRFRAHHFTTVLCCVAPLLGPLLSPGGARADEMTTVRSDGAVCSAWDVHITTLIEDFGRLNIVGPSDLAEAAFQQIQARVLCLSGRMKDAVEIYERIAFPMCAEPECADAIRRE